MQKRIFLGTGAALLLAILISAWYLLGPATTFAEKHKYLYIRSDRASYTDLLRTLSDSNLIAHPAAFRFLASKMDLPAHIRPGRYLIRKGSSLLTLVRLLRNGHQDPVKMVIIKLRTRESFAGLAGRRLECDSADIMNYLENNDSLRRFGVDSNTVMTLVFPNTYTYFWNSSPGQLLAKMAAERDRVWDDNRRMEASHQGITPEQAYILASIVEEETNAQSEKGNIASVYLNRLRKGMKLQADPTVKFALRNFGLKRIYEKHLTVESPYNTYRHEGLPPGPICTPSLKTLDAVLQAPSTDYLYFVASSDFSGHHVFSATYKEHLKYAKAFQEALDKQEQIRREAREDIGTHQ